MIGLARRVTYLVAQDHTIRLAYHDEFSMKAHVDAACAEVTRSEGS